MNLKLEKDSKKNRVILTIRPKGGFSKDFALAFFIALCLHVMAFTLFQIDLGTFFSKETVPAVSFVSTEKGSVAGLFVDEKQDFEVPGFLQIDRQDTPQVPLFLTDFDRPMRTIAFLPDFKDIPLENMTALCKSNWHFSQGTFHAKSLPELTCEGIRKGVFAFRLHGPTIFWLQMIQSTGDSKLDKELEEAFKGLKLTSLAKEGIAEVEFLP